MLTHRNTYTVTGSLGPTTPWKGKSALRIPGLKVSHQSERVSQEQCLVQKKAEWGLLITTLDCYKIKLRL